LSVTFINGVVVELENDDDDDGAQIPVCTVLDPFSGTCLII